MLEIRLVGQRGPMTTGSDQNGLNLHIYVVYISTTKTVGQSLLKTNKKSSRLPIICHNHRYCLITGQNRGLNFSTFRPIRQQLTSIGGGVGGHIV